MESIDNKKAYDMVPQNWFSDSLKMYKISDQVKKFIENTMEKWRVELTAGGKSLTGENPWSDLPGRCAITFSIYNSDNTIQSHT